MLDGVNPSHHRMARDGATAASTPRGVKPQGIHLWPMWPETGAPLSTGLGLGAVGPVVRARGATHAQVLHVGPDGADVNGHAGFCPTPVVFLPGLIGLNEHWMPLVQHVRHLCHCVCFEVPLLDLPFEHCSIDDVTEMTARFLEQEVGEPAVLVGNSFGGHVAARLAIDRPDLVRALILTGASGLLEKPIIFLSVGPRPSVQWMRDKFGAILYDQSKITDDEVERVHSVVCDKHRGRALVKLSKSARKDCLEDRLNRVRVPTLLVWGRQDSITPAKAAEGFNRGIAGSRLVWLDRCSHAAMVEQPEAFAAAMRPFLMDLATVGAGPR